MRTKKVLVHIRGGCEGQQTWEARVVPISLRTWRKYWLATRTTVRVRSDSVSALTLALKLKASGSGPAIVARELALDMAECLYRPIVAEHLPGVANITADELSRLVLTGSVPAGLKEACRVKVPKRSRLWWRALAVPLPGLGKYEPWRW